MNFSVCMIVALLLDACVGDPDWYPHPVKLIGKSCSFTENQSRKYIRNELFAGSFTVILVLLLTGGIVFTLLVASRFVHPAVEVLLSIALVSTTIAVKDLLRHSLNVYSALKEKTLQDARNEIAKIVGRDTKDLGSEDISKACVETVAENMVDGITSPIFFAFVASLFSSYVPLSAIACGALGAIMYKAVNTMDSMFGYKNERYILFGRTAARLDDVVNFIPARLSGMFLVVSVAVLRFEFRNSAKTFFRDRLNHSSPNAGHTEAAVAGALGIRLGGPSVYFGRVIEKPTMGEKKRDIVEGDILATNKLVVLGAVIFTVFLLLSRYFILGVW